MRNRNRCEGGGDWSLKINGQAEENLGILLDLAASRLSLGGKNEGRLR